MIRWGISCRYRARGTNTETMVQSIRDIAKIIPEAEGVKLSLPGVGISNVDAMHGSGRVGLSPMLGGLA